MRCPLRVAAFDKPDECDRSCALLMAVDYPDTKMMCAIAVIAAGYETRYPVGAANWMEVSDGAQEDE